MAGLRSSASLPVLSWPVHNMASEMTWSCRPLCLRSRGQASGSQGPTQMGRDGISPAVSEGLSRMPCLRSLGACLASAGETCSQAGPPPCPAQAGPPPCSSLIPSTAQTPLHDSWEGFDACCRRGCTPSVQEGTKLSLGPQMTWRNHPCLLNLHIPYS